MTRAAFRPFIADRVKFERASVKELRVIHEKMRLFSDVAYAMAWQGCCQNNAAGDLMLALGDAFTEAEAKAGDELQRRQPTDMWDREDRLGAVAERIIANGDDAETVTFIQELTAFAAEQARS